MSKEIATTAQTFSVAEVQTMARAIADSGLFGVKSQNQAFALMLIAQAEGRHPATVAQEYDIIQGRPALKSAAALARFQLAGGKVSWIESNDERAIAEFSHPAGGTLTIKWDMERAKAAQLLGKDGWKKYPGQMLRARCAAEGPRALFPVCLNGMYVSEELRDMVDEDGNRARRPEPRLEVSSEPPAPTKAPEIPIPTPAEVANRLWDRAESLHISPASLRQLFPEGTENATEDQCRACAAEIKRVKEAAAHVSDDATDGVDATQEEEDRAEGGDR